MTCTLMSTWIDRALAFDPTTRRCDRAFDGRDCVIDATPATPLMLAVGLDRRARLDDDLPDTIPDEDRPHRLDGRRGWCGDALDAQGRLTGSRMWLIRRRKQDEPTRKLAENALKEAVQDLADARGWLMTVAARWYQPGVLAWSVKAHRVEIALTQAVG